MQGGGQFPYAARADKPAGLIADDRFAQAAVVDPMRSPGGLLTLTDGLRVVIGD